MTPSSDPASGLGEGEGGQAAVVSPPASRPAVPRAQETSRENLSHVLACQTLLPRATGSATAKRRPLARLASQGDPLLRPFVPP